MNSVLTRIATGFSLGALALGALFFSPITAQFLILTATLLVVVEFFNVLNNTNPKPAPTWNIKTTLNALPIILGAGGFLLHPHALFPWLAIMGWSMVDYLQNLPLPRLTQNLFHRALAFIYIIYPTFLLLHMPPWAIVACLCTVFMGDTFAYACGLLWGRHPMAPMLSPKKSWEGSAGGLLASGITFMAFSHGLQWNFSLPTALILGASLGAAGQVGDFLQSGFKRHYGYKDSGTLLPGHGGMWDRLDGVLLAVPLFALYYAAKGN